MRAAFYECDITPPLGNILLGNAKNRCAEDVVENLYAKAAVFESDGECSAIVVIDACMISAEIHDSVVRRVYEYTGITADKIAVCANHTHRGVPLAGEILSKPNIDPTYKEVTYRRIADAIILAYKRLRDVNAKFVIANAPGLSFNRNFVLKNGKLFTHGRKRFADIERPLGGTDDSLPILMLESDGAPIGAIVSFAMHQDSTPDNGYCGDYSSILSKNLKKKYGPDFVSLFLIGPSGDINNHNPNPDLTYPHFDKIGERLAEVFLESASNMTPVLNKGVKTIKEYVEVNNRYFDSETLMSDIGKIVADENFKNANRISRMLAYVESGPAPTSHLPVQCMKIGDVLIVFLPGEIYNEFSQRIKTASPYEKIIVVEMANEGCGYVPTKNAFCPNSYLYEAALAPASHLAPEAGDVLTEKAIEMMGKI